MADDLPALAELPDDVVTGDGGRHAAEWASRFGGQDRSLAQRARHNQDIETYTSNLIDQQRAHQSERIASDQTAQNLWYRQQQLDQAGKRAQANLQLQHERIVAQNRLTDMRIEQSRAATAAATARAEAAAKANTLKQQLADHEAQQTTDFTNVVQKGLTVDKIKLGTPEYADLLVSARMAFPGASTKLAADLWKGTNSPVPFEDAMTNAQTQRAALTQAGLSDQRVTVTPKGVTVTAQEPKAPAPVKLGTESVTETIKDKEGNETRKTTTKPIQPEVKRISVIAPDGRKGFIPESQLQDALKAGYKQ